MNDMEPVDLDHMRLAGAYPRFLRGARMYVFGLAAMMVSALVVYGAGLDTGFFLISAAAVPFVILGAVMAWGGYAGLHGEFPHHRLEDVRGAATAAAFGDLLRRRVS
jgi:hypothetical protein